MPEKNQLKWNKRSEYANGVSSSFHTIIYIHCIHQWAINMEYNVNMPHITTIRNHFRLCACVFLNFFLSCHFCTIYVNILYFPLTERPFTASQTCLIMFNMDYFSFLFPKKRRKKLLLLLRLLPRTKPFSFLAGSFSTIFFFPFLILYFCAF